MAEPHIRILMGTYQGVAHLPEQLESFCTQSHRNWSLWVSDDGSSDRTWTILERFAKAHPGRDIRLLHGPKQGVSANYLSLLCHPDLPEDGGLVALSDQDDVWMPDRLAAACAHLQAATSPGPRLYAAPTVLTDTKLRPLRENGVHRTRLSFSSALVHNVVAGNTVALCPSALRLVRRARPVLPVPFHDWWLYLLVTGAGGQVVYDDTPRLYYRQHGHNTLGAHHGVWAALRRACAVWNGTYSCWVATNLGALSQIQDHLTSESRAQMAALGRNGKGFGHLRRLKTAGIRRGDPFGQMALSALALAGRI